MSFFSGALYRYYGNSYQYHYQRYCNRNCAKILLILHRSFYRSAKPTLDVIRIVNTTTTSLSTSAALAISISNSNSTSKYSPSPCSNSVFVSHSGGDPNRRKIYTKLFFAVFLSFCCLRIYTQHRKEKERHKALASSPDIHIDDYKAFLYQILPLRGFSKLAGYFGEKELPKSVLNPVLNLYCWYFNVNLDEALDDSLDSYKSLSQFFQRELKPAVRVIDEHAALVVPCDGRVLHYGRCQDRLVEQVKGVSYSLERFLGTLPPLQDAAHNDLFFCVLYLAPGDYHLFHSPCSWRVEKVTHFPGTLMSVNPTVCRYVPNILTLNERVLLSGSWQFGYLGYAAVGATNVGSIRINFLKDQIQTNKGFLSFTKDTEIELQPHQPCPAVRGSGGLISAPLLFSYSRLPALLHSVCKLIK